MLVFPKVLFEEPQSELEGPVVVPKELPKAGFRRRHELRNLLGPYRVAGAAKVMAAATDDGQGTPVGDSFPLP